MNYRKKHSGQVLFLGIVMVLIIFFAIFLFFDIHNIIRGKIKLETAEQSAALTACRWQAKSLNLIGELNLLVAAESVLRDTNIAIPVFLNPEDKNNDGQIDQLERLYAEGHARIRALNEMQSRITFIGPLIALAATQQAAKNNGISPIKSDSAIIEENGTSVTKAEPQNVLDDFKEYLNRLANDNNIYAAANNLNINGYQWRKPYIAMLTDIVNNGIAVRPNATIVGLEGIRPSYLADLGLYPAIHSCARGYPAWCHWRLRQLVKEPDSYFEGVEWYTPDFSEINFSQQSEVYPLDVRLEETMLEENAYESFRQEGNIVKKAGNYTEEVMQYAAIEPFTPRFYHYNQRWDRYGEVYTGPIVDIPDTPWRRGVYLSRDVAEWAVYGGAVAYSECVENIPETLPFRSLISSDSANKIAKNKATLRNNNMHSSNLIKRNVNNKIQVGGNYTVDQLNTGCVAKPLGKLSGDRNPVEIPIVLPLFTRVNLIPSLMQEIRIFSYEWPLVEKFILRLKEITEKGQNIYDDIEVPEGSEYMLEALRLLGSKEFRRKGWNPEYKNDRASDTVLMRYFERNNHLYHPTENPSGPGWLQQPVVHGIHGYRLPDEAKEDELYYYTKRIAEGLNDKIDPKKEQKYAVPPEGEVWACYKGEYIKVKDGVLSDIMENDPDKGCGKKVGTNPGRLPAGTNMSPERL